MVRSDALQGRRKIQLKLFAGQLRSELKGDRLGRDRRLCGLFVRLEKLVNDAVPLLICAPYGVPDGQHTWYRDDRPSQVSLDFARSAVPTQHIAGKCPRVTHSNPRGSYDRTNVSCGKEPFVGCSNRFVEERALFKQSELERGRGCFRRPCCVRAPSLLMRRHVGGRGVLLSRRTLRDWHVVGKGCG